MKNDENPFKKHVVCSGPKCCPPCRKIFLPRRNYSLLLFLKMHTVTAWDGPVMENLMK